MSEYDETIALSKLIIKGLQSGDIPLPSKFQTIGIYEQIIDWAEEVHVLREKLRIAELDAERYHYLRRNTDWFDWDIVVQAPLPAEHPAYDDDSIKIDCAIDFVMGNLK